MKFISILLLFHLPVLVQAQAILMPSGKAVEKQWIKNQQYQMSWYALQDTNKIEIGTINTEISNKSDKITVVTQVNLRKARAPWIDSSVANAKTLEPIYHSSYNEQRDMVLQFGKVISGFYNDKINKTITNIRDTVKQSYFDSNLYPFLVAWLPLKEDYHQDISIYDYSPADKGRLLKAFVIDVKKGIYESKKSGIHNVWMVSVADEITGAVDAVSTYYIDMADRKLWKQDLNAGGKKMMMLLTE